MLFIHIIACPRTMFLATDHGYSYRVLFVMWLPDLIPHQPQL